MVKQKLDVLRFGLAGGIITALCVAFTSLAGLYGYFPFSNMLLADIYGRFGYALAFPRCILGVVYSFIDAFIATGLFAFIYNKLI